MPLLFQESYTLFSFWARPRITTAEEHKPALVKQLIVSLFLGFQLGMQFLQEKAEKDINNIYFLEVHIDFTSTVGKSPKALS